MTPLELTAEPDPSLDQFARVLRNGLDVATALVTVVEPDRQVFPGADGLPARWQKSRSTPLSHSFCQYVVKAAAPLIVSDARLDARFVGNRAIDELGVIAYAGFPLIDHAGAVVGSVCAIDDAVHEWTSRELDLVSDVAQLCSRELRLRAAQRVLARSYEQLTMFAGQISHDLKSPLTAVNGFLELLADHVDDGQTDRVKITEYVTRSRSSTERMLHTIEDVLAYAAIGGALKRRAVPLDEVMAAVLDDVAGDMETAKISWDGVDVPADPVQLRCLLQNLVANSLTYRSSARPCVISISSILVPGGVEVRVVDNGTGIPADRRSEVLRPLWRLRRDVPGSGLGLATCDRIVTAHEGIMQIGGTPGGGTTITVVLPTPA